LGVEFPRHSRSDAGAFAVNDSTAHALQMFLSIALEWLIPMQTWQLNSRSKKMQETIYKEIDIKVDGNTMEVCATGKFEKRDYEMFVPAAEKLIKEHGKIRVLFVMQDFHGWTAGAVWEDIKFDLRHFNDIERLAIVGESKWEQGMAVFCRPFTTASMKYFDISKLEEARQWIAEE
jgi:hypothetical protein